MKTTVEQILECAVSKKNEERLKELAIKNGYKRISFLVAPDKIVSNEAVTSDLLSLFEAIDRGDKFDVIYTTKGK